MVAGAASANAQDPPELLHFEGHLEDQAGVPITADLRMTFAVYDQAEGGAALWSEAFEEGQAVPVVDGLFGVYLGQEAGNPIEPALFAQGPRYLGVTVDGVELLPRQEVAGAPYALFARQADTLQGQDIEALLAASTAQCLQAVRDERFVQSGADEPLQDDLDMGGHELRNPVIHNAEDPPEDPAPGQLWFDTRAGKLRSWNGEAWDELGSSPAEVAAALVASDAFRGQIVQQLLADHLPELQGPQGPQGEPGQDADPAQVADALVARPDFVAAVVADLFAGHADQLRGPQGPAGEGLQDVNASLLTSVFTQELASTDTPIPDPQDGNPVESTIDFPHAGTVRSVRVTPSITHPDITELTITLTSPTGTVVTLHAREAGLDQDDLSVTFPDDRQPSAGSLDDYIGEEASGPWTLSLVDQAVGDIGTLEGWSLEVVYLSADALRVGGELVVGRDGGPEGRVRANEDGSVSIESGAGGALVVGAGGEDGVRVEGGLVVVNEAGDSGSVQAGETGALELRASGGSRVVVGPGEVRVARVWLQPDTEVETPTAAAAGQDALYVAGYAVREDGGFDRVVQRRDPLGGRPVWERVMPSCDDPTSVGFAGNSVLVGCAADGAAVGGWVARLESSRGGLVWDRSTDESVFGVAATTENAYFVGAYHPDGGDSGWWIEKRDVDTAAHRWTMRVDPSGGNDSAMAIVGDAADVYVLGTTTIDGRRAMRLERRSAATGDLVWSQQRGAEQDLNCGHLARSGDGLYLQCLLHVENGDGVLVVSSLERRRIQDGEVVWRTTSDAALRIDQPAGVGASEYGVVVGGTAKGPPGVEDGRWWLELRSLDTGALLASYTSNSCVGNEYARALTLFERDAYLVGTNLCGRGSGKFERLAILSPTLLVEGDFMATGAKSFAIPHPLDPSRQLVHACIEGPEAAVYYRGEAQLDAGQATITLPDYFEALTHPEGRTVQLTPVGGFDPIAIEPWPSGALVEAGAFRVRSAVPASQQRFVWEVKAVRKDLAPLVVER